jgi:pilus assembly protein CpaE
VTEPIRIFISGSCAGLAEVRQALSSHSAIKVVGTAVDAPSAGDRLREEQVDVLLHGSSRGDRLPTQDIHTLQAASPAPIVIVTSGCTPEFLQEALAHGVQDVAILPQLTESLVFTLRRAHVLNNNAPRQHAAQAPSITRSGGEGRVVTVFSPKGGVGKSTLSTGLAGVYANQLKLSTLLIDLDLQFGDVGIMMGIDPTQTIVDLVTTTGELDPDKLSGYIVEHSSGMHILAAPLRPEDAELVTEDRIGQLIDVAKVAYDVVVLDTPPHFDATTLAALDRSDRLILMTTMDIPTVKNAKLALQTLNLLQYPRERIALVVNRPLPRADLRESDISRTLDMAITAVIPGDKDIGAAVNRGVPVTVSSPRAASSKVMRELAELMLPQVATAESKSTAGASGEAKTPKQQRIANNKPSAGRQSLFKAGVSKFSKSKDKKAA